MMLRTIRRTIYDRMYLQGLFWIERAKPDSKTTNNAHERAYIVVSKLKRQFWASIFFNLLKRPVPGQCKEEMQDSLQKYNFASSRSPFPIELGPFSSWRIIKSSNMS